MALLIGADFWYWQTRRYRVTRCDEVSIKNEVGRMLNALFAVLLAAMPQGGVPEQAIAREFHFQMPVAREALAEITASAPGASWERTAAEGVVATISLDGEYNQDLILTRGGEQQTFRVFLGPVAAGVHLLRVARNERWSAASAGLNISDVRVAPLDMNAPEYRAISHAPILYARADTLGRFTDAPLLTWYERFPQPDGGETIQYSIVYTNEDGGTPTDALMARWGRTTDIEYVYRLTFDRAGNIGDEIYQAPDHHDLKFQGHKLGQHPFFLDATLNNVFLDVGYSSIQYRFVPVPADLTQHSREELMDEDPWIYRVMAQEIQREGKLRGGSHPPTIADQRQYLYLELNAENHGSALAVWVKLKHDPRLRSSHLGRLDFAISRNGWFRTTVELPPNTKPDDIESVGVECIDARDPRAPMNGPAPDAVLHSGGKAFLLDKNYRPGANVLGLHEQLTIKSGEMVALPLSLPR